MAARDTDPRKRVMHWKAAAERDPRNTSYWKSLAETYLDDNNYGEAGKAWHSGEQAATDPVEREKFHRARMLVEQQRLDHEEAEKRREADEKARELQKLKTEARADLHKAEAKFSEGAPVGGDKPVPWWDGPKPDGQSHRHSEASGLPAQTAGRASHIEDAAHKLVKLLVADPSKVVYTGNGEVSAGLRRAEAAQDHRRVFPESQRQAGHRRRSCHHRVPVTQAGLRPKTARATAGWSSRSSFSPPPSISWTAPRSPRWRPS